MTTRDFILGTAGHIDHGKTSLIKCLTGVDTDRLPEEKRRGITIELGFAQLAVGPYRLGIVDVPGHERFVRQMLAGATGMDLALLVVAADDSVKPQTREHLDVLRILDLPAGVIALTKCDTADPEWIELVEEEVRELVRDTFLAQAPIVRTSAVTGEGIEALKQALEAAARLAEDSERVERIHGPFRMGIDRAFTIAGHGTVVTGSVSSGTVRVGDQLMVEPGEHMVRVRGLQNHDRVVDEVVRGQRAAINLAGIHHEQVRRGHELATPGHLVPSRLVTVDLTLLDDIPRPVKHRSPVRLHIGTAEIEGRVALLDADQLAPEGTGYAQLFLRDPVVSVWNQPYVVRNVSPAYTLGGGRILVPNAQRLPRRDDRTLAALRALQSPDVVERADAAIYLTGTQHTGPDELTRTAGIAQPTTVYQTLVDSGRLLTLSSGTQRVVRWHVDVVAAVAARIRRVLGRWHDENPLSTAFDIARLAAALKDLGEPALFDSILQWIQSQGDVRIEGRRVGLTGRGPQLSRGEQELMIWLVQQYLDAGLQPPTVKDLQQAATKYQKSVPQLIQLAAANGDLIQINHEFYLHRESEQKLREILTETMQADKGWSLSEIREQLSSTRKYAVPFCEYLDRVGFTRREGDLRWLNKQLSDGSEKTNANG